MKATPDSQILCNCTNYIDFLRFQNQYNLYSTTCWHKKTQKRCTVQIKQIKEIRIMQNAKAVRIKQKPIPQVLEWVLSQPQDSCGIGFICFIYTVQAFCIIWIGFICLIYTARHFRVL